MSFVYKRMHGTDVSCEKLGLGMCTRYNCLLFFSKPGPKLCPVEDEELMVEIRSQEKLVQVRISRYSMNLYPVPRLVDAPCSTKPSNQCGYSLAEFGQGAVELKLSPRISTSAAAQNLGQIQ